MAFTKFATSEPWDTASGPRLNKLGDELQEQINVLDGKVSWQSVDWKTENSPPSEYGVNTSTVFYARTQSFNGSLHNIVETKRQNSGLGIQFIYGLSNSTIKYRREISSSEWGKWQEIATTTKTEILWEGSQASGDIVLSKPLGNYHSLIVVCGDTSSQQSTEIIPSYYPTKINTSVIFVVYHMSNFIRLNPKATDTINILANAGNINVKKIIGVIRGDV